MPNIWTITNPWVTPATHSPRWEFGEARVVDKEVPAGVYQLAMRDTKYFLPEPLKVTAIQERDTDGAWHDLMTDEPRNWYAMLELAFRAHGDVLVGGFGLGLVQWALEINDSVSSILTIERNPDVFGKLEDDAGIIPGIVLGNLFSTLPSLHDEGRTFDTIITDIAPIDIKHPDHGAIFQKLKDVVRLYPKALHLHHGYQKYFDIQRYMQASTKTDYDWLEL